MPPSWKKSGRITRLISGLRSNRAAASSLSVETGFPTSLADLLVKNHSRLKTKKTAAAVQAASRSPSPPTPASALALTPPKSASTPDPPAVQNTASAPALTPPKPASALALTPPKSASAPADSPAVQRAPAVRLGFSFLAAATVAATQAASRSPSPPKAASAPADPPAAQRAPAVRLGFSFLVAEVLALVLLTIGEKQLVFRITVLAFALIVLDLVGVRVFELLTPGTETRKGIDRELEAAVSRSGSSASEGSVSGELVEMRVDGAVQKVPRKKSWQRLVPKRLRSKRSAKDSVDGLDSLDSGSFDRRVSNCGSEEGEQREGEARDAEICVVQSVEGNACECRSVSSRRLLLFVVLLFGLAGGRVAALAVTVAWFMLTNSIDTLWRKSRVHRVC